MSWETMEDVIRIAESVEPELVDITGGAPELNPSLPRFLKALADGGHNIQLRTNLTVLQDPRYSGLMDLYRNLQIRLVASLPCHSEENVDEQRGRGVFKDSIRTLRDLNKRGYGIEPELELNLVYNPDGPTLPAEQSKLEGTYKEILASEYGIHFNRLLTITNMPIGRFKQYLEGEQKVVEYQQLLENSFNPSTIEKLMCRHQICVGWDGLVYDCDFNFALKLPVRSTPRDANQFDSKSHLNREIVTGSHCFGCTAGCGSSCEGSLEE
jgi:radical SAM/Cys-rich protein